MKKFELVAPYKPMGDQIQAIERITSNLEIKEVKRKMVSMEPFKENINLLLQFFDEKEENNYDK